MSFQQARNLQGQKDQGGYQKGVGSMVGRLLSFKPKEFNTKGKPSQKAMIRDLDGEEQEVKVWLGNGPEFQPNDKDTLQTFQEVAINLFKNNMYYKCFWDNMHPPTQDTQAPPQTAQAPPGAEPPAQRQTFKEAANQAEAPDWDEIARSKVRCALVCAVLSSGDDFTVEDLDEQYMDYIFDGLPGTIGEPNPKYDEKPTTPDDDIPF